MYKCKKTIVYIYITGHFGANAICVRKISREPMSEEERSLVPFESVTGFTVLTILIINFRFRRVSLLDKELPRMLKPQKARLAQP